VLLKKKKKKKKCETPKVLKVFGMLFFFFSFCQVGRPMSCITTSLKSMKETHLSLRDNNVPLEYNDAAIDFFDPCSCKASAGLFDTNNMRESGKSNTSRTIVL